jgi:hypothetical protein
MAYQGKNKVGVLSQAIAGPRTWYYTDTGSTAVVVAGAAFFSDGKTLGMKVGDIVQYTNTTLAKADRLVVTAVQAQDTGVPFAEVGDTGASGA